METQNKEHPSALHLAALALGKLKPDAAAKVQSHLDDCGECRSYVSDTPRDELAEIVRQAKHKAAEQNTLATGLSGTIGGVTSSRLGPSPGGAAAPTPPGSPPSSTSNAVQHAVSENEIPRDLYAQSKYRIIRVLGRGGMGTVYQAEHVRMKRPVAIKVINPEFVNHPQALSRFEKEIEAVASLDHTNIARAFDAENIGSLQVFVMEFVRGQTLYDFLKSRGRLSAVDACRCVRQALVGLQHAHQHGLVHRDLKPQNLMLTRDTGQIKILDFGLAKAVSENRQSRGLTSSRATMGTYAYMAPEQALDAASADIRADIYSLGCTLYYLIGGVLPFDYETDAKLLLAHQNEVPCLLHEFRTDVPEALSALVARMLAKNPADRPQTPKEAADALLPFARGDVNLSPAMFADPLARPARKPRGMDRWKWGGIAAALLAVFGFGGWAAGLFSVRTPHGTIIVENAPADADVSIDGNSVTVARSGDSLTIAAVEKGPHHLKLSQGGREIWSNDIAIKMAGELVHARFEASTPSATTDQPAKKAAPVAAPHPVSRAPQNMNGVWRIEGGELIAESSNQSKSIWFGDATWTDVDLSFECCRDNDIAAMGGNFRNDLAGHLGHYGMGMFGGNHWCEIGFARTGEKWSRKNRRGRGFPIVANTWYQVRVSCRCSDFSGFIDGQQLGHMTRDDFPQGCVGLWAHKNGIVRFRNIKVTAPDGTVLWEGFPDLNLPAQHPQVPEVPAESPDGAPDASEEGPSQTSDNDDGFVPLFNGKDLAGWIVDGDDPKSWTVENGVLFGHGGADYRTRNYLLTDRDYADFILRLEFSLEAGSSAAAVVRAIPGESFPFNGRPFFDHPIFKLIERRPTKEQTGTTHWILPRAYVEPNHPAVLQPSGSWNNLEMEVRGNHIRAFVNGAEVLSASTVPGDKLPDGTIPGLNRVKGRIGLQKHTGLARYRNIEIKELPPTSDATSDRPPREQTAAASGTALTVRGVTFPAGAISFADEVVSFVRGADTRFHQSDTKAVLGSPDAWDNKFISLGQAGTLIVKFNDNALVGSGNSDPDLCVFEGGPSLEPMQIAISANGADWIDLGRFARAIEAEWFVKIDIDRAPGVAPGVSYRYVKIVDVSESNFGAGNGGADIGSIGAITTIVTPPPAASNDKDRAASIGSQSDIEQLFPPNSRWTGWRTRDGDRLNAVGTVVEIQGNTVVLDFGSRRFRLSVDGTNVKVLGDEPGIGSAFITTDLNLTGRVVGTELSFEGTEVRLDPKTKRQLDTQNVKFVLRREDGPVQQDKTSEEISALRPSSPAEGRAQNTNRAPSGQPKSAGLDLIQKETVWKGYREFPERFRNQNQLPYELRITSRKGKEFTGVATFDGTSPRSRGQWCEVAGSIERNGRVQWKTKTGSGTGDAGPSTATLVGNKLKFEFQTRRGNGLGELTLVSNAAAPSDAPKNAAPGANETNGK